MESFEGLSKRRVVEEGGQEHLEFREKNKERQYSFFGEGTTRMFRDVEKKMADPSYEDPNGILRARGEQAFMSEAGRMRQWYEENNLYASTVDAVIGLLSQTKPKVIEALRGALGTEHLRGIAFIAHLSNGAIQKGLVANFFEAWHGELKILEQRTAIQFEAVKQRMIEKIPSLIARGQLSADTNIDLVKERAAAVSMSLIDPLDADRTRHLSLLGASVNAADHVLINPISFEGDDPALTREHVMVHELAHAAISGRKLTVEEIRYFTPELHEQKFGLRFLHYTPNQEKLRATKGYYSWLNEAKTEKIARSFSEFPYASAYNREIAAMDELIQSGVPETFITEAYQEDYRVGEKGIRLPKVAALIKKINEVKGRGWLLEQERQFATLECET